jgi:hypothetical protein
LELRDLDPQKRTPDSSCSRSPALPSTVSRCLSTRKELLFRLHSPVPCRTQYTTQLATHSPILLHTHTPHTHTDTNHQLRGSSHAET